MKPIRWFTTVCNKYWRVIIVLALLTNAIVDHRQSQEIHIMADALHWTLKNFQWILEDGKLNESCQY